MILFTAVLLFVSALAPAVSAEEEYRELGPGSGGEEVLRLQTRLQELGYDVGALDGNYGSGTKNTVKCFQATNGLEQTGIADAETLRVLFSDSARRQTQPGAEIVRIAGCSPVHYVIRNNLDVAIDRVVLNFYPLDENGGFLTGDAPLSATNAGIGVRYTRNITIQPGSESNSWEYITALMGEDVEEAGISICGYHTADGNTYEFDADQIPVVKTFGTSVEAPDRSEQPCLSDEECRRADSVRLGYQYARVYPWLSEFYGMPEGDYVMYIESGSLLQNAGIVQGDILLAFGGHSALDGLAAKNAKLRLLEGETVEVRWLRGSEEYTAELHLN